MLRWMHQLRPSCSLLLQIVAVAAALVAAAAAAPVAGAAGPWERLKLLVKHAGLAWPWASSSELLVPHRRLE